MKGAPTDSSVQDENAANDTSSWTLDGFDACSSIMLDDGSKPNWHTLESIEIRRRAILLKVEQPLWRILVSRYVVVMM